MRWMLIVAVLAGCSDGNPTEEIKARAAELSSGYKQHSEVIVAKQDQALATLTEVKSRVGDLLLAADDTKQRLESMEASLVKSNPNGKEADRQSALEPQEPTRPNLSQPVKPVASAPAVRLFVTHAPFACPPCERLKRAVDTGEFAGFEVVDSDGFTGLRSYPAIRFETPSTETGWGVVYGYDSSTIPTLRAMTQGTSAPVTGAFFPLQAANTVTSSGFNLRSVSRWVGHSRGQRIKTRSSCSSGACR